MEQDGSNFAFLAPHSPQLARLGALAERHFTTHPPDTLVKLRQFAEFAAKDVAARHALLPKGRPSFDEVLQLLRARSVLPRVVAELFFHLKRVGNLAAHEDCGSAADALQALKIARAIAAWFHQVYAAAPGFKPGPFVPPSTPPDATAALRAELDSMRATVAASADAEAIARLAAQQAAARADTEAADRAFWERFAADTEAELRRTERALLDIQRDAAAVSEPQLDQLVRAAAVSAASVELDEPATRAIIDGQLRAAGWAADSTALRHAAGTRPDHARAVAIAEWPTRSGPADYALFVDGRCLGVVEAKRQAKDVPGQIGQARRYARDIVLTVAEVPAGSPWIGGDIPYAVPFCFVTNGRPYVKQLETKSGIWFWDARTGAAPHALPEWFSPRDLLERLEQAHDPGPAQADRALGVAGLRPYQVDAVAAVQAAIATGQRHLLLAMATGTGKTRLAIALIYELLRARRFRRVLFLVDRNALGRQTLDAMGNTEAGGLLKFDQVFPVADLARRFPDATDRVHVATVQAMVGRTSGEPGPDRPTPGTYDLIIVDEAHRGYTLDAELREEDLAFRNLDDYLSAYRRVLDFFDATVIALTATPALHTREIFGPPVFHYGYRQAVVDGYLVDHRPPRRITTALSQAGISFAAGERVDIVDPRSGQIDLFDLPDQVDFEVAQFNRRVYTRAFNRAVADAIAAECPPDQAGKTLLFAARDDHADTLVDELREALKAEHGPGQPHDLVEKITGATPGALDRIKAFKNDPRPKYVVTVDLLTTGIDVPAITNLVFVRRVNSRILYDQMLGRATRLCPEIGKAFFRIFDAVDIYANLQEVSDMRPVVVDPALSFTTLLTDLARADTDTDRAFVRDQVVVKLRGVTKRMDEDRRAALEAVVGPLPPLLDRLAAASPAETASLFARHPALAATLDARQPGTGRPGIYVSEHPDELVSVEDDFGRKATPGDYIAQFEAYVRANMNTVPALVAATQRPRELTRRELKQLAVLLDEKGFSEANLRRAYGSARNADIAAHIIGFVRQAALGDPLVPYEARVESGLARMLASRDWTPKQRQWLGRIGRALRAQPVGDPDLLADPLFAQAGGFAVIDREFDAGLGEVLKDLNEAVWASGAAA